MSNIESPTQNSKFTSQNLFFLLLVLQFVIAPFYYQPNFGGEGLYLPYNSSVWVVAVWIIAAASLLIYRTRSITLPKYWFGLAMLPIGAITTGFLVDTTNSTEWLTRLCVITGGYLFFLALFQFKATPKQIDQSLYVLLAMGMIAATYGIFQVHGIGEIYSFIPRGGDGTPIGIFQQVNIQASLMATLLVLVYYLISRPTIKSTGFVVKVALCFSAFSASYLIAASGSRVGLLGAFIALSILIMGRWRLLQLHKGIFFIIILFTAVGAASQSSGLLKSSAKFDRALGGMEADVRWKVYKISWDLFLESPITGHGLGSFQKVFQDKRRTYQQENILHLGKAPRFSHPHNELFLWLVEGGLISLTGILVAAIVTFLQLIRVGWQRGSGYAALLIPIALHSQVELPFYTSNTHWLLLLFLLFITHLHCKKKTPTTGLSLAANRLIPITFMSVAIIGSWFLIQAQIANAHLVKYAASRNTQQQYLNAPVSSYYFRQHALYLLYRHQMLEGLKNKEALPVLELINYTELLLETNPALMYYIELINAYNILGETEKRDQKLQEALNTYESNQKLLYIKQQIDLKETTQK
ncbi:MAG: Wzy polymerase domain-containing protein [Neptuniibacter sp.]